MHKIFIETAKWKVTIILKKEIIRRTSYKECIHIHSNRYIEDQCYSFFIIRNQNIFMKYKLKNYDNEITHLIIEFNTCNVIKNEIKSIVKELSVRLPSVFNRSFVINMNNKDTLYMEKQHIYQSALFILGLNEINKMGLYKFLDEYKIELNENESDEIFDYDEIEM
ncbi:hypothetical protein TCON_1921 [Astathelohania contejeani]|uniref:RNA polymerase alpha subunit n=1 Tax=Astathelohania contejeani TaxID=164912 RepID=A0ABQ7HXM0_9MICR|nr:hypothetical protein TCON_1921 [Thelohania contejeani]